jgi:hypothetical protein
MVNEGEYVAIFNSVHRVMKAEKLLKGEKLPIMLIPAPRALSSDCGLAIRYSDQDRERVEALLASASLVPVEVYQLSESRYTRVDKETL